MTREEAIEEIKRWTPILLTSGQCTEETSKAQDMAISALAEPDYKKILDDIRKDLTNPNEFDGLPDSNYWQVAFLRFIDKHMRGKAE